MSIKRRAGLLVATSMLFTGCTSQSPERPVEPTVATTEVSPSWRIGTSKWVETAVGTCLLERGGTVTNNVYTGVDRYQTGAECPDGTVVNLSLDELKVQNNTFDRLSGELRAVLANPHPNTASIPGHLPDVIFPIEQDFIEEDDFCYRRGAPVNNIGSIGTGELVMSVGLSSPEDQSRPRQCADGTVFLVNPRP